MVNSQKPVSGRHIIEAARAAALETRRRKREAAVSREMPDIFVVRLPGTALRFGWESRAGAVVLDRSRIDYPTMRDAYAAGRSALPGQGVEA